MILKIKKVNYKIIFKFVIYLFLSIFIFSGIIFLFLNFKEKIIRSHDFEVFGYASLRIDNYGPVSGGLNGREVTIRNLDDLLFWAESRKNNKNPEIVYLDGYFYSENLIMLRIENSENVSVYGLSKGAVLENIGFDLQNSNNFIFRNLNIKNVRHPGDAFNISRSKFVWIDHCELSSQLTEDKDYYDGLIDINDGSSFITVSWNFFHDHNKTSLIGNSDSFEFLEKDMLTKVTYHHNWFKNVYSRNPSLRFGVAHIYNNFYEDVRSYAIVARNGAIIRAENNYFKDVKKVLSTEMFTNDEESNNCICGSNNRIIKNNILVSKKICPEIEIKDSGCNFWSNKKQDIYRKDYSYSYFLDKTENVPLVVKSGAGIGKIKELYP